ncbi:hypothetical protein VTO73DRAFT_14537 [Trametes versicolor]
MKLPQKNHAGCGDPRLPTSRLDSPRAVRALRKSFLLESPVSQYAALRDETVQDKFEGVAPASSHLNCAESAQLAGSYGDHVVYTNDAAHASRPRPSTSQGH